MIIMMMMTEPQTYSLSLSLSPSLMYPPLFHLERKRKPTPRSPKCSINTNTTNTDARNNNRLDPE